MVAVRFFIMSLVRLWGRGGFTRLLDEVIITFMVVIVIFIITLIDWGLYLLDSWRLSLAEIERFKKEKVEFQFEMLRNQINPHFLFNSLNTVSSLIYENADAASKFVKQLAKVYRYVLDQQSKELVSLEEEKVFIKSFIYMLELRFANNLEIRLDIPEYYDHYYILPMTLQMLLENCLKHNIVSIKRPLHVHIYIEDGRHLVVENNLQRKPVTESGSQVGLSNIKNRYAFLTEKPILVEERDSAFVVKIPLIEQDYASIGS
jgi:LytS/YehU family sensor histidine kinase